MKIRDRWYSFVDWFNAKELSENTILLGFATAIGAAAAFGVVLFYSAVDVAYHFMYQLPGDILARRHFLAYRPVVTACGLAAAAYVMRRLAPGHDGSVVPAVQLAVAREGGRIDTKPAAVRTLASVLTLGGGASAGSEGPVAVLGSAVGSWLSRMFSFDAERVKVLVGAGAAAGISAAFNAPLAGAFFALEEILGSFAVASFPPVVIASVMGAVVSRYFFGNHPAFPVPHEYGYTLIREVVFFYPFLGLVCALASVVFVRMYFGMDPWLRRVPIAPKYLPWFAGALVGCIVWISNGALVGHGHLAVRIELFGRMSWYFLAALAFGKIVTTAITLNGGGSGGVFTPSLYVGLTTGGAVGVLIAHAFPGLNLHPEAYAVVGMGAVVAAATAAPLTGILIVFEMTNDYAIMLPLMLTTAITYIVTRHLEQDSLYSGWLRRRGERIEQGADPDVLSRVTVLHVIDRKPPTVLADTPLHVLIERLEQASDVGFVVVDREHALIGMIGVADISRLTRIADDAGSVIIAADVATPAQPIPPHASLLEAIRKMGVRGSPVLPVVDPDRGLIGIVTRAHVLAAYEGALARQSDGRVMKLAD